MTRKRRANDSDRADRGAEADFAEKGAGKKRESRYDQHMATEKPKKKVD